jgi:GMP reductase
VKEHLPEAFIIAGNVATKDAVGDLASWGADCVKVGIGQGYVCTTKDKTGFTQPMFSCMLDCVKDSPVPIIADGGIKCNGDVAKALVAGASIIMAGSLFSQCIDSPAISTVLNGAIYKQYFGSASEHNKGGKKHIEGVMKEIPSNNMSYEEKLEEIRQDLQSSISYAGGEDISCLKNTDWILV